MERHHELASVITAVMWTVSTKLPRKASRPGGSIGPEVQLGSHRARPRPICAAERRNPGV